ncbi:hypothetical protein PPACK8108_LOCUS22403 [Phakopsora pachyrhizi]|uniref:SAP domain-containing protein n=1 Tax=Phakopsora pachyrhizi TaxID=170000 RepID=A0AAV0BMM1_PHAPC|nr:hypothetical protein PPACK8108_LOCUS22403 [Phakopsora pachyrhizi]
MQSVFQGQDDRLEINKYAHLSLNELKKLLQTIGCTNVLGKEKEQLVNLCQAYHSLLDVSKPNLNDGTNSGLTTNENCTFNLESRELGEHEQSIVQPLPNNSTILETPPNTLADTNSQSSLSAASSRNSAILNVLRKIAKNQERTLDLLEVSREQNSTAIKTLMDKIENLNDNYTSMQPNLSQKYNFNARVQRGNYSHVPQNGKVKELIHQHVKALLGLKSGITQLPSPASKKERQKWIRYDDEVEELEENSDCNQEFSKAESENSIVSMSETEDPHFPFPGGPGHKRATPQQLQIMWNMMQERGVSKFHPNFGDSIESPDNRFLWSLAHKIFVRLVECGEYQGIDLEASKNIHAAILGYVEERLMRTWRNQVNTGRQFEKNAKAKIRTRRNNTALAHDLDETFLKVIEKACSDDESDTEARSAGSSQSLQRQKLCKVKYLQWRSKDLTEALIKIDYQREIAKTNAHRAFPGVQGRIRRRPTIINSNISEIKAPKGLPRDCYDLTWLNSLSKTAVNKLGILECVVLPDVMKKI